jgi:hypothetical protein
MEKKCKFEKQIDDYLLNRLSEKKEEEFEKHYFICPNCSKELIFREKIFETIKERGREIFKDIIFESHEPIKINSFYKIINFLKVKKWAFATLLIFLIFISGISIYFYQKIAHSGFFAPHEETLRSEIINLYYPHGELRIYPQYFYWNKIEGSSKYILSIYDNKENLIWKIETTNNKIKLPEEIKSKIIKRDFYFWEIKALSNQGLIIARSRRGIFRII